MDYFKDVLIAMNNSAALRFPKLTKSVPLALAIAAASSFTPLGATQANAQETLTNEMARVSQADTLPLLVEAIASATCRIDGDMKADEAKLELAASIASFDSILNGLKNGDPDLGMMGAEPRARIIMALEDTMALWSPYQSAASGFVDGTGTAEGRDVVADDREALFEQVQGLSAIVTGQYSELLDRESIVLNFAIGQRALAYDMTREMCDMATGHGTDEARAELQATTDRFGLILTALRDGMPAAGVTAPPTDEIRGRLADLAVVWETEKGAFDAVLAGQTPTAGDVIEKAALSRQMSDEMKEIITLYREAVVD